MTSPRRRRQAHRQARRAAKHLVLLHQTRRTATAAASDRDELTLDRLRLPTLSTAKNFTVVVTVTDNGAV